MTGNNAEQSEFTKKANQKRFDFLGDLKSGTPGVFLLLQRPHDLKLNHVIQY